MYETCFETTIGSHMWGMQRPDSDIDTYRCYIAPSKDFLLGLTHSRGHQSQTEEQDRSSFELGHVINQLKKGNINHIEGLMSPIINESSDEHEELKKIFLNNLSKNAYHSIHGMAFKNYKRYFEDQPRSALDENEYKKKLGQIGRILEFGFNFLMFGQITFKPCQPESRYAISNMLGALKGAYENSPLPEKPDDKVYDDFLLKVRLDRL